MRSIFHLEEPIWAEKHVFQIYNKIKKREKINHTYEQ